MNIFDKVPIPVYKILIIVITAIWGVSFVVMKDVVEVLPPALLLGIRFTVAGLIVAFFLRKQIARILSWKVVGMGVILGALDFLGFFSQTVGLQHTTPGINAFLTATYCVIVPFVWWVIGRKRPTIFNILAAVVAVTGIWFVSVANSGEGFSLGLGEGLTLLCAFFFALHIVVVSKFASYANVLVLTAIQFLAEGCFGLLLGLISEPIPGIEAFTPTVIGQMLFLIIFASVICFGVQNISLSYVPPAQASLFLSLESVFGVIFSVLLYGEVITLRLLFGFALIFIAILISELFPIRRKKPTEASRGI